MAESESQDLGRPLAQPGKGVETDESVAVTELATTEDGGLLMLKERQRKDEEEIAAGLRDPRSLWVVGKGDLKGVTFTRNPASKFSIPGTGW